MDDASSLAPAPLPLAPERAVRPPTRAARVEGTGLLTLVLFFTIVALYLWTRWGPQDSLARAFAAQNYFPLAATSFVLGDLVGLYTIIRGARILQDPDRTARERLRAGYGISYAAFGLAAAFLALFLILVRS